LPSSPHSHRLSSSYSDQRSHKINYVATDWNNCPPVSTDRFCTHCNRFGEEYCPLLNHRHDPDSLRHRVYAVHIDGGHYISINRIRILCWTLQHSIILIKINGYRLKIRGYPILSFLLPVNSLKS
jgi:hypothetical protein